MKSAIDSVEKAFAYEGVDPDLSVFDRVPEPFRKKAVAGYQLDVVNAALNREANNGEKWVPKYDGSERHHFPYFYRRDDNGSGFSFLISVNFRQCSTVGSRREYISEAVSDYAGKTFTDLYRDEQVMQAEIRFPAATEQS